jgi:nucleotide-binding universal stress UspA family protein
MYQHILIPLENTPADETILTHIKPLARMTGAKLLLVHVSDGWVARNFNQLKLAESEEMKEDRAYLESAAADSSRKVFPATPCSRSASLPTRLLNLRAREMSILSR